MDTQKILITEIDPVGLAQLIKEAVSSELQNHQLLKPLEEISPDEDLLTREEAKKLLKTSYTSLWKYDREGLLPAKRIAGRVYYFKRDLFNLLNGVA